MKKYFLYIAAALLAFTSCDDSQYELQNLVPGQYHKILVVKDSGKHNKTLYDTGDADTTNISVMKVGSDPSLTAHVDVRTLTDEELRAQYSELEGVNYKTLSSDCYHITNTTLDYASSDRYKTCQVILDPHAIETVMATEQAATWVLPLKFESKSDSVNANSNEYLIIVDAVVSPKIGFVSETPSVQIIEKAKAADYTQTLSIGLDVSNKWDVDCGLSVDESYVATYNQLHSTEFTLLPKSYYELPNSVKLEKGKDQAQVDVKIKASSLPAGDYVLPVALSQVSRFETSSSKVVPLVVRVMGNRLDRSSWKVTANTEEPTGEGSGNGVVSCMLDGNLSTYWHSQWSGGSHALPYEITIDMKSVHTIDHVSFYQRQNTYYADTKDVKISVSTDNAKWTEVSSYQLQRIVEEQLFEVSSTKARYIKFSVTSSHRDGAASLAEFYVYGE